MVYVILCNGDFDGVWETKAQANREKRDLERMGNEVRIKPVKDWAEAEALEDKMRGY
jgi:hypothetical protein